MFNKILRRNQTQEEVDQKANFFIENGFLIYENVLTEEFIHELRQACDELYEIEKINYNTPAISVDNILALSKKFSPLIKKEPIFSLIKKLFGPDLILLSTNMRYCLPGTPNQAWHIDYKRDWPILRPEHPLWKPFPTVIVAYYFDNLSLDNGPLWIVPKSHQGIERPPFEDINVNGEEAIVVSAGSSVVFDARLWHRAGGSFGKNLRRAVFFDYSLSWVKRPIELSGGLIDEFLDSADLETRALLR